MFCLIECYRVLGRRWRRCAVAFKAHFDYCRLGYSELVLRVYASFGDGLAVKRPAFYMKARIRCCRKDNRFTLFYLIARIDFSAVNFSFKHAVSAFYAKGYGVFGRRRSAASARIVRTGGKKQCQR